MSHLTSQQLVEYWSKEVDDPALEDHLFECEECTLEMERIQRVVSVFRDSLPPVITAEQLAELRSAGLVIEDNAFKPGQRKEGTFTSNLDLLVHRLPDLPLADATRVGVTVRSESGPVMHEDPFAPFDRARGEVLIACQKHFAVFPRDVAIDVRVYGATGEPKLVTYAIPHVFG
jgi:hypothetical protein